MSASLNKDLREKHGVCITYRLEHTFAVLEQFPTNALTLGSLDTNP